MKILILAAGFGTRLKEITKDKSKCLLEVNKIPIIERIVNKVKNHETYVITNNKFYQDFVDWKSKISSNVRIINDNVNVNEERLGSIGDINFFLNKIKINEDLLIIGADNLLEFDINDFINYSKNKTSVALYKLERIEDASRFGVVQINEERIIINFEEKPLNPKSDLVSTAYYVFKKEDLLHLKNYVKEKDYTNESRSKDNLGTFIKYLSEIKPVYGYLFNGKWFDIGTIESLKEAEDFYKNLEK